jgi:uncharacterized protein YaiI (UPF0178 family)
MKIWVDADACPKAIKEILYRAAERRQLEMIFVANRSLHLPPSRYLRMMVVGAGFDVADHEIIQALSEGDLVITADIPLAAEVIAKGAHALDPRGTLHDADSIGERLSVRNFMDALRESGVETGGPATMGQSHKQAFANAFDAFLSRRR